MKLFLHHHWQDGPGFTSERNYGIRVLLFCQFLRKNDVFSGIL